MTATAIGRNIEQERSRSRSFAVFRDAITEAVA